jgi:hypothetical protein
MVIPGGRLPEAIANVPPDSWLVMMNPSYPWPMLAPGSSQTPLTSVPPLEPGSHSRVSGGCWVTAML